MLFWSAPAIDDLTGLRDYIAQGSEYYAVEFIQRILQTVQKLEQFPGLGRIIPEIEDPAARELIFQNYRILYRLKQDRIDIAAVIHGRRDIRRKIAERWEIV
ncbi:MAG: plasmid stabilization protein [Elusimicrobia bacterium RIFCSPLOWO2_01_FULL_59_12]|nr:MAG: plasmid stabilization protein [Elusimicrobia bacterium RIFCSPLOWO2_01_FULL_59_12]